MRNQITTLWVVLKLAFARWWTKDPFKESAVIAYYAIFSLPGLLVVFITFASYFFGAEAVNGQIKGQITSVMGADTAQQIQDIIVQGTKSRNSVWATIIGVFTILLGATGVFVAFQKSLNVIWNVQVDETKSGLLHLIKARLLSFGLIIAIAFILTVSLVISAMLAAFGTWVIDSFSQSMLVVLLVVNFIVSLGTLTLLFAFMFKFFPDAKIKWRHVWLGSLVTAVLFEIGKSALGLYFAKAEPGSGYGAAGSLILILLWVSYSSMIVFLGAEFTHGYAERTDGTVPPDENGTKVIGK